MDSFFEAEVEMERKICRDVVCNSRKDEEGKHTSASCALHTVMETLRHKCVALLMVKHVFGVCQAFSVTCASCFYICYYLLEISTTRT